MKTFRDYLSESEAAFDTPVTGDDFAIVIREECLIESYVVDTVEDGVVIAGDSRLLDLLESYGYTTEAIRRYGAVGSSAGMGYTMGEAEDEAGTDSTDTKHEHGQGYSDAAKGINKNPYAADTPAGRAYIDGQAAYKRHFNESQELALIRSRAGLAETAPYQPETDANHNDPLAAKAADDAAVGPMEADTESVDKSSEYDSYGEWQQAARQAGATHFYDFSDDDDLILHDPEGELYGKEVAYTNAEARVKGASAQTVGRWDWDNMSGKILHIEMSESDDYDDDDKDPPFDADDEPSSDKDQFGNTIKNKARHLARKGMQQAKDVKEAEYQGRKVKLNKPMAGDVAKSKVYVKDPKTGNVKKVNFGDPNMRIKKSNPERRKSFRARHNCDNPGPKTKARYWSCRAW